MKPSKQCNYCNHLFESFLPYRGGSATRPKNMVLLQSVGSDVDEFACPVCGAHDRERHLKLYCEKLSIFKNFSHPHILHFAPEQHFRNYLEALEPELHIQADLFSSLPNVLPINIEAIPYDDQSFDIVIANHILEHVHDVDKALSEINRVLKKGGIAILQTPYSNKLAHTFEDPGIDTDELRQAFYGQEDHVRLFGRDIMQRFSQFLDSRMITHHEAFGEMDTSHFGVNINEPFFLFEHRIKAQEDEESNTDVLRTEAEIRASWHSKTPLVSINCITFNHEKYIHKAIESFLSQKTTFPIEIVIGEDHSTDETLSIISQYQSLYPNLIRLITSDTNVGPKNNTRRTMAACQGKYIAICEGDDYWTDPKKLQKQVDYLENHPDCVITYSAVQAFHENGIDYEYVGGASSDVTSGMLKSSVSINTLTTCFRKVFDHLPPEHYVAGYGDLFMWSLLGHHGDGHYLDTILPSRYRIHAGGLHSMQSLEKKYVMLVETYYALYLFYKRINDDTLSSYFLEQTLRAIRYVYTGVSDINARHLFENSLNEIHKRCDGYYEVDLGEYAKLFELNSSEQYLESSSMTKTSKATKHIVAFIADPLDHDNFLDLTLNVLSPIANLKDYTIEPLLQKKEGRYHIRTDLLSHIHSVIIYDKAAYFSFLIPYLKENSIPVLFYISTDVWNVDAKHAQKEALDVLQEHYNACIQNATLVITANEYLSQTLSVHNEVITPFIDPTPWNYPIEMKPRYSEKFTIVVYVDPSNLNDISMIAKFIQSIQKKYENELYFIVHGINCPAAELQALNFVDVKLTQIEDYFQYTNFIRSQPVDLVLTPLVASEHNLSASPFNYFIQSLCGVVGIYSNWGLYKEVIQHGETGFLCAETELDWEAAIVTLMRHPELRTKIAQNARQQVLHNFTVDHALPATYSLLERFKTAEPQVRDITSSLDRSFTRYELHSHLHYPFWCETKKLLPIDISVWESLAERWNELPEFYFFLYAKASDLGKLADTIDSFVAQLYPQWNLYVISETSSPNPLFETHPKLHWIQTEASVYDAINHVAANMQNGMIGVLTAGDKLQPHALTAYTEAYHLDGQHMIYSDHDSIDTHGIRIYPQFKPDFNLDMLRSVNYISRSFVISSAALIELGGINSKLVNAELYDLVLRYCDRFGEKSIGHCSDVLHSFTSIVSENVNLGFISSKIALQHHLMRNNLNAEVTEGKENTFRVLYYHETMPLVSIIIPTKNQFHFLQPCIQSILDKTTYTNYEIIIVDNGSTESDAIDYLQSLKNNSHIQVIDYNEPFNYSTANNLGAKYASGEFLLLLNNDTEVLHENWLDVLLSYAQREDVGIVGPRLIYPNQTIQHAGVIIGLSNIADHQFISCDLEDPGYMSRLQVDQSLSSVTAAVMLIKRKAFDEVYGLNDTDYHVNFSDVDLCLKVITAGYKTIFTPHATLLHHGSVTQKNIDPKKVEAKNKLFFADQRGFRKHWKDFILHDPAYNVNLDTGDPYMSIRTKVLAHWNPLLKSPVPKIFGMARGHDGGGFYRITSPLDALQNAGKAQTHYVYKNYLSGYIMMQQPDILIYQTPLHDNMISFLEYIRTYYPKVTLIFEIDDLLTNIPIHNRSFHSQYKDTTKRIQKALKFCDRMVVSTQPLKDAFSPYIDDIRIVPNYIPRSIWGMLEPARNRSKKLRVGWAGSIFHKGDLAIISKLVTSYHQEVEWVFFGMVPEGLEGKVEFHAGVSLEKYPQKLATLALDLALVPLEENAFNDAKSNLRLLEFGMLGWPVICSDAYPYRNAPVTCVKNRYKDWEKAFLTKIAQPELLPEEGTQLKQWVEDNYILEEHVDFIYEQYTTPSSR